jgi:hypothetical protein
MLGREQGERVQEGGEVLARLLGADVEQVREVEQPARLGAEDGVDDGPAHDGHAVGRETRVRDGGPRREVRGDDDGGGRADGA